MRLNGVKLDGRLGNHLFQYAYILSKAQDRGGVWFVDQIRYNFFPVKYFAVPSYRKALNALLSKLYQYCPAWFKHLYQLKPAISQEGYWTYHIGFFQDESYFAKNIPLIRSEFAIKKEIADTFKERYKHLSGKKTIGVHIRRTDIVTLGIDKGTPTDTTLPLDYYYNCFAAIPNIDEYTIVFASDDVAWVREKFGHMPNAFIEDRNEITDFMLLSNSDIVVIANSSFSWWAAYLNAKPNKQVYMAKHWGIVPYIEPPLSEQGKWQKV